MDRMKKAMDLAIAQRVRMYDIEGHAGENVGVWLDVGDVVREMIMACAGRPGKDYQIVLSGDGRYHTSSIICRTPPVKPHLSRPTQEQFFLTVLGIY